MPKPRQGKVTGPKRTRTYTTKSKKGITAHRGVTMSKVTTKTRGRPLGRTYPPRIDATPEDIAHVLLNAKPARVIEMRTYHCAVCERAVAYPETLYDDGRCETCHALPT